MLTKGAVSVASVNPDGANAGAVGARCAHIVPVILAGGSGTRLWPVSRENYPKQLIDVVGTDSLLQATARRMDGFPAGWKVDVSPIIVCGEEHRFVITEQLLENGVKARLIVEPARRDTAPALTLAASLACADGDDAILIVMPADHSIADVPALQGALERAARYAEQGSIATLGVPPTRPDTGFGYIRIGTELPDGGHAIDGFVEKPAEEIAAQYVAAGTYWWNAGIFVVRARVWLDTLKRMQPEMHAACERAFVDGHIDGVYFRPSVDAFLSSPADSIDYAVMERLTGVSDVDEVAATDGTDPQESGASPSGVVVRLDAGWSDLGSWDAVWAAMEKDANGNAGRGRVAFEGAVSSYAHSEGRLVACVGTTNVVVVETADAVLVVDRSHVQDVKGLVSRIKAQHAPEADAHRKVHRPWGFYDSIDHGERFQVKRIVVTPGAKLSLQLHHHRAEHWVVVRGTALVTRGEDQFLLSENESTYIPIGTRHRLENPGKVPLEIIEIQSGTYLGEDDIVRFNDNYGRCS
ncbi:sugar phosphate nucleotidyltransferase [Paraburkholderia domus]|jgi:mannose-1-phosphate guanylyltransferase / mannose-6-phosphate isomerase|uniref:Alginate biosynthesis protein AlgA n=1 Tax=Paraburkholderia domus TaxID=2793075 RepID=A0A9N8QTZ8_9BURK|nr:sugar phosphate nucleotidyltransferase [Paraburkholderia domus]MBK5165006.1 cupin domain-containing protein [Burkholderia sp. R-70211]MBK5182308.1 cupin domain-containing protein [Burkholderia sp. R-69749]MCI0151558.1 cupin domain-containing protein [Paraburkholderia sediminicola]CAE6727361.1 Alginate biosynthesis protein AlgA [Paraburkholderia domus]CAE6824054.1 Alginate biosynthesis protein AlgA [Paraburkholderia domus]